MQLKAILLLSTTLFSTFVLNTARSISGNDVSVLMPEKQNNLEGKSKQVIPNKNVEGLDDLSEDEEDYDLDDSEGEEEDYDEMEDDNIIDNYHNDYLDSRIDNMDDYDSFGAKENLPHMNIANYEKMPVMQNTGKNDYYKQLPSINTQPINDANQNFPRMPTAFPQPVPQAPEVIAPAMPVAVPKEATPKATPKDVAKVKPAAAAKPKTEKVKAQTGKAQPKAGAKVAKTGAKKSKDSKAKSPKGKAPAKDAKKAANGKPKDAKNSKDKKTQVKTKGAVKRAKNKKGLKKPKDQKGKLPKGIN